MKRLFTIGLVVTCFVSSFGFASGMLERGQEQAFAYRSSWSVVELAQANRVPPRKLAAALKINLAQEATSTLSDLGVDEESARRGLERYRRGESGLVRNIAFIGMSIVFASLIVVAFLISLLRHLHIFERTPGSRRPDRKSARARTGRAVAVGTDMSDYALAAVATAIFLHEEEVEEENRLLLTWKRTSTNMWKAARSMPNTAFYDAHRGRK
jgi:Na+-transporting methylmalonyl-CoA/oxaloacetate decarboxylase gamma subunit